MQADELKITLERSKVEKELTNKQITEAVQLQLQAETKENLRRDTVYDYFFGLTGVHMSAELYKKYIEEWDKRTTYNIATFIKDYAEAIDTLRKQHKHDRL